MEKLVDAPDFEWLMIDASHIKYILMQLEEKVVIKK